MSACPAPLQDDILLDWWTGDLGPAEARRIERHVLDCAVCADRAAGVARLAHGVRELVKAQTPTLLLPALVERFRREGRRTREYQVPAGGSVQCTIGPDDDVVYARLAADLEGVSRLDAVVRVADQPEQRFSDLLFDRGANAVLLAPPPGILELPPHAIRVRLLAVEAAGERLLGEYRLDHSPWPDRRS